MLEHIVLFKLKDSVPEEKKREMLKALLGLRTRVPGILQASAGTNVSDRAQGYTHGFVVRFKDRDSLDHYLTHPVHVAVVDRHVKPLSEGVLALDYEILDYPSR